MDISSTFVYQWCYCLWKRCVHAPSFLALMFLAENEEMEVWVRILWLGEHLGCQSNVFKLNLHLICASDESSQIKERKSPNVRLLWRPPEADDIQGSWGCGGGAHLCAEDHMIYSSHDIAHLQWSKAENKRTNKIHLNRYFLPSKNNL